MNRLSFSQKKVKLAKKVASITGIPWDPERGMGNTRIRRRRGEERRGEERREEKRSGEEEGGDAPERSVVVVVVDDGGNGGGWGWGSPPRIAGGGGRESAVDGPPETRQGWGGVGAPLTPALAGAVKGGNVYMPRQSAP
ncbi:hypothetical protein KPH14_007480 [Odynerus spinipes]|uniref:Uncharacterized protein n=1 Tax=Odynerus spinipes TaxID=1348599 RepID=A0AAD9VJN0_9HYME|nr:hypothetical protein KPH14_007480 [Odynerus spinipes]